MAFCVSVAKKSKKNKINLKFILEPLMFRILLIAITIFALNHIAMASIYTPPALLRFHQIQAQLQEPLRFAKNKTEYVETQYSSPSKTLSDIDVSSFSPSTTFVDTIEINNGNISINFKNDNSLGLLKNKYIDLEPITQDSTTVSHWNCYTNIRVPRTNGDLNPTSKLDYPFSICQLE